MISVGSFNSKNVPDALHFFVEDAAGLVYDDDQLPGLSQCDVSERSVGIGQFAHKRTCPPRPGTGGKNRAHKQEQCQVDSIAVVLIINELMKWRSLSSPNNTASYWGERERERRNGAHFPPSSQDAMLFGEQSERDQDYSGWIPSGRSINTICYR